MRLLALDIGRRRTGVAFFDESIGIAMPLQTIEHQTDTELFHAVSQICATRRIDQMIVGLPLLPSGDRGEQAQYVSGIADTLRALGLPLELRDERFTTPRKQIHKHTFLRAEIDGDAAAACALLQGKIST
jgi:putative holliday junction resolvase